MNPLRLIEITIAVLGLLCSASAPVLAQAAKADEYKKVIEGAVLEFDSGNWPEARVLFEQAHALRPSARTLRGMGKVSFELKQYVRAQHELNAALVELRSPLSESQRHEVLGLLLRIEKFIGRLTVRVKPTEAVASITLDGTRVEGELKLDLGQHDLSIQAPGFRSLHRIIAVEGGKTTRLELTLARNDQPNDVAQPTASTSPELAAAALSATEPEANKASQSPISPQPADHQRDGVLQQWWFWTIVSAVVVGGAVTAVALTAGQSEPEPAVPGNTGLSIQVLTFAH